ncbi:unnamed protein product [Aspergillus oryzae]|uniref:Unnamed protein product n=1 Tax=Aspergillus oryzae TaxID=5062 RepID=A0AAN4YKT3_ASPOZ|nr:unnamed protein product [Aspergillus oryzae]GMF92535.1 unnamed protein product [Aspergillus oryzae]GMG03203.1 unnamed protein product [Aspergillus oryzae]GMG28996.1 unnamed protein product [Aspergillus oryzae]
MPSDKVEKKRKRASNGHERPSKKPALEFQDLPPLAASVVNDDSELAPVISMYSLTAGLYSQSACRSTRNKGIVSSELLLQTSEHPKMDFVGREAEDDADSQLKHYIAVVDPEKKSWQFVEVRKVTLRGAVRRTKAAADEEEEVESEDEEMSMAENAQLSNAPAGAASAAESAILSSMPLDSATDIATKTAAVQAQVQANKPLPQANLAASHPSDVYPIDVLVPGGLSTLQQLPGTNEWQETVNSGEAVATTSRYVSRRVEAVVNSTNATQLQVLRFIFLLLELARALRSGKDSKSSGPGSKRLPPRDELRRILSSPTGAKTDSAETLPDPVIDAIRRKFAPQGTHITKNDITFLHTTICALSLHIPPQPAKDGGSSSLGGNAPNELATDPSDLRDDLRLDNTVITQYFRELGCRVDKPRETEFAKWGIKGGKAEANARRVARLRVPVEFPKVSRGGKR